MKVKIVLVIIGIVFLFGACSQLVNLTPEGRYYTALKWYNDNLEEYLAHYNALSETEQAKWRENYHPIFMAGDKALNAWKSALGSAEAEQGWKDAKKQILGLLISLGIVEIEEGGK